MGVDFPPDTHPSAWCYATSHAALIDAPEEDTARAFDPDVIETTELLAPAERRLAYDTIDI
jgi:hypothetical protein